MNLFDELQQITRLNAYATTGNEAFLKDIPKPEPITTQVRLPRVQRVTRQHGIESDISDFRPTYDEAVEILAALLAGLESRYTEDRHPGEDYTGARNLGDVQHAGKAFRAALEKAPT